MTEEKNSSNSYPDLNIQADIEAVNHIPMVSTLLEVVCRTTGMGFAAIARVTEDKWVALTVRDEISFGLLPGGELKLETTICNEIRQSGEPVVIDNVAADEHFRDHHTPAMYGFQSYISVPIFLKNGSFFGTLCAIDPNPAKLNTPAITGMFRLFTDLISMHLNTFDMLAASESNLLKEQNISKLKESYNAELAAANEELAAANEELAQTQNSLQVSVTQLTGSNDKLQQAIYTGKMGTWGINPTTFEVTISDYIKELFGFPLGEPISVKRIVEAIDPAYQQKLTNILKDAVENHKSSDISYPIINLITKERKWVRATGKVFFDQNGKPSEYSGMLMDVTEQKQDEIRKSDFIGMVSHELKTPLTSLSAYVQMLHSKAKKEEDSFTEGALEKVSKQVKKMTVMINSFLNVSRLEAGKILVCKEVFNLDELLKEVIEETTLVTTTHTISCLPCDPLKVNADRDKIGSVVSNLLSNAIKYSPKGKVIELSWRIAGDVVKVSIKDEGMGIKEKDQAKLFERYYRVETTHTEHISGFGIGLYLSAEIVHRHDGEIGLESQSGVGSTFWFTLPLTNNPS